LEALGSNDPTTVGNYRLTAVLGSGGMGRVYLAHSPSGRRVAIKVIRADLVQEPDIRQRFAREVAASRAVSGFFTAGVVDADLDANPPWLVTTFIPGPSLGSAVGQVGPLPLPSVRAIGAALAEALSAIHAAGLIHRDLKPGNILLASDGPRLIDFGISALSGSRTLTHLGAIMGSPGYMSPEQIEGKAVGPSTDVFALGAVLVFAVTGTAPFGGDSVPSLLYKTVHAPPDLSHVPDELRPLLASCLDKDPSRRPDLLTVLRECTSGQDLASMFAPGWLPAALTRDADTIGTVIAAKAPTAPAHPAETPTTPPDSTEAPTTPPDSAEAPTTPPHPAEAPTTRPHPAEAPTMPPRLAEPTPVGLSVPATPVAAPIHSPAPASVSRSSPPVPVTPVAAPRPYGQPGPAPGAGWPAQAPATSRRRGLVVAIVIAVVGVCVAGIFVVSRMLSGGTPSAGDPTESVDVRAVPAVGTCHVTRLSSKFNPVAEQAKRVACEAEHTVETIASGPVDAATHPEQPGVASPLVRDLYARCETAARRFLGAPWRTTYTMLVLSLPSAGAWRQGATWYRCDLASSDIAQETTLPTTGTLKGKAEPIRCLSFTYQGTTLGEAEPSDCTAPHHGELAGLIRLPDTDRTAGNALVTDLSNRCAPVVLGFLGSRRIANELTYWFIYDDVNALDRNVLCIVAIDQDRGQVVGSLRGIGERAIPVR
jgi:serine/threonine protein kinase